LLLFFRKEDLPFVLKEKINMRTRPFGSVADVSVVGQGTWQLSPARRVEAVGALRCGLDAGMNHIDTAEMYAGAEEIVGEAIAGRRDEVFLVSKVLPNHGSRAGVIKACEQSLKRLSTDRLDCYLLHWPGSHPLAETVAGFEWLVGQGKIRSWGVSNFDTSDLDAIWQAGGRGRMACNQVLYHLAERAIEHAVLPWCRAHGVSVVAYSPFGSGDFPEASSSGAMVLEKVAERHGATARQVALQFLLRAPEMFVIPKASSAAHAADNAGAGDLALTDTDMESIDRAFPRGQVPRHLPMI
jgi:diketogulonate reductase-like aldo/keto reductase